MHPCRPDREHGIPCGESLPRAVSRQSMRRQQSSSKSCHLPLPHRLYWTSQHPRRSSDTETRERAVGFFVLSVPGGKPDSHARPLLTPDDGLHQEFLLSYLYLDNGYGSILGSQKPGTGRRAFLVGRSILHHSNISAITTINDSPQEIG